MRRISFPPPPPPPQEAPLEERALDLFITAPTCILLYCNRTEKLVDKIFNLSNLLLLIYSWNLLVLVFILDNSIGKGGALFEWGLLRRRWWWWKV